MDVKMTELQKRFLDCLRNGGVDRWARLHQAVQESGGDCMLHRWQYEDKHHDAIAALAAAMSAKPEHLEMPNG